MVSMYGKEKDGHEGVACGMKLYGAAYIGRLKKVKESIRKKNSDDRARDIVLSKNKTSVC